MVLLNAQHSVLYREPFRNCFPAENLFDNAAAALVYAGPLKHKPMVLLASINGARHHRLIEDISEHWGRFVTALEQDPCWRGTSGRAGRQQGPICVVRVWRIQ